MSRGNTLSILVTAVTAASAAHAVPNFEIEPNEFKFSATLINSGGPGMASGDTIVGVSTGDFTGFPGDFSTDYYRIRTIAAPPGIYRHRLSLSAAINAYSASIRGLNQSELGIQPSEAAMQTAESGNTTPPRFVQWYGFGKQEQIYYRVSGTALTPGPYTVTLESVPVVPIVAAGTVTAGPVTIAPSADNFIDIDFWVYDADFNPVPTFGADEPNTATRTLAPGTYYIAWSNWNLASNQPNPATETFTESPVMDFPDVLCCSSQATFPANNVDIISASGAITVTASKPGMFDIEFIQFTVVPPPPPTPIILTGSDVTVRRAGPGSVPPFTATILAAVSPGSNPTSDGIAVTTDLTAIGGAPGSGLHDDGTAGDAVAGDNIWSLQIDCTSLALGTIILPLTATDTQGRTAAASAAVTVEDVPLTSLGVLPFDDADHLIHATLARGDSIAWFAFTLEQSASDPDRFVDIHTGSSTLEDTEIALFDATGARLSENDDWDAPRSGSGLSFGRIFPTRTYLEITSAAAPVAMTGQQGELPGGEYFLAVAAFDATFAATGFGAASTAAAGGDITVHFITSSPVAPPRCQADINHDGTVDGSDFTAFINSFGVGDATVDADADVSGGGPDGDRPDGIIDGSDFIAFINAFGAGC